VIRKHDPPAHWRHLRIPVGWNATQRDLTPGTAQIVETIRRHDRQVRTALARTRAPHLLYERWVSLIGILAPTSAAPLKAISDMCAELGWGLSATFALEGGRDDAETLVVAASLLTRIEIALGPSLTRSEAEYAMQALDRLAKSKAALVLHGDIATYRRLGATKLASLQRRPHSFSSSHAPMSSLPPDDQQAHGV